MIAAFLQLNHSSTAVTSLPSSLLGGFQKRIGFLVLRAVLIAMPFAITQAADLCLASATLSILLAALGMNIPRLDPFATPTRRTVYPVLCSVFLEFLVPQLLERDVKQSVHVL